MKALEVKQHPVFVCAILIVVLVASGCASKKLPDYKYPLEDAGITIDATQEEIAVAGQSTSPMVAGGGVLGVLVVAAIDGVANSRAEEAALSIRNDLVDFNVGEEMSAALKSSPVIRKLSMHDSIEVIRDSAVAKERWRSVPTFWLVPTVEFSNNFRVLKVQLAVAKSELNKYGKARQVVTQTYRVDWPLKNIGKRSKRAELAEIWAAKGPEEIKQLARKGIDLAVVMLDQHLEAGKISRPSVRVTPDYDVMNPPSWLWRRNENMIFSFPWMWQSLDLMIATPESAIRIGDD